MSGLNVRFRSAIAALVCAAALAGTAAISHAGGPSVYMGSDGQPYSIRCNPNGFVMQSLTSRMKFYFGRNCDAYQRKLGGGNWCSNMGSAAGFGGSFGPYQLYFAGYEPYCPGVGWISGMCPC